MATFTGTSGNDTITGSTVSAGVTRNPPGSLPGGAADSIDGGSGNDSIDASGGNDTVNGGSGNDTLIGGDGNDVLDGGTYGDWGDDRLSGGGGADTLYGYGADTLDGGGGNDLFLWGNSFSSQVTLIGGAGIDTLKMDNVYAQLSGFSLAATGIEIVDGSGRTLEGTTDNNVLNFTGVSLVNVPRIDGNDGDDSITGFSSSVIIDGGSGNDTVVGSGGNDVLDGGTYGDWGDDRLSGGGGADTLYGYGADTLDGGGGNDLFLWGNSFSSQVTLIGGAGIDTLKMDNVYAQLFGFSLAATGIEIVDGSGRTLEGTTDNNVLNFTGVSLVNVPRIDGNDGDDSITGFSSSVIIDGGSGNDTVVGSGGNDVLDGGTYGDWGDDRLSGGGGADTLYGYGADTLDGGGGNDLFLWGNSFSSQVTLIGGAGIDTLKMDNVYAQLSGFSLAATGIEIVDGSGRTLEGTTDNNVLNFTGVSLVNVPRIDGNDGADSITGFSSSVIVDGGSGNDTVVGSGGNDVLDGGTYGDWGDDRLSGGGGADTLYGYGADTLDGGGGNDLFLWGNSFSSQVTLIGGAGIDTLKMDNVYAQLFGFSLAATGIEIVDGSGRTLEGTTDNNVLNFTGVSLVNVPRIDGNDGDDSITGFSSSVIIDGGSGNDTVVGSGGNDVLDGGTYGDWGDDRLSGGGGADTLYGYGADTLDGGGGNDLFLWGNSFSSQVTLIGGAGIDTLKMDNVYAQLSGFSLAATGIEIVDGSGRTLEGTTDNNVLNFTGVTLINVPLVDGGDGNDSIIGSAGGDTIAGGYGNDTLIGGAGDDFIYAGYGDDSFAGGDGVDTIDFRYNSSPMTFNMTAGTALFSDGSVEAMAGFENLYGGDGNDSITGTGGANRLWGEGGDDTILGGAGNDTISGGAGADSLNGQGGIDTIDYAYATGALAINLVTQTATSSGGGSEVFASFENAIGGQGDDSILGTGAANTLDGQGGNDTINAGGGDDTVAGGFGNDSLIGGAGVNTLDYSYSSAAGSINLATATADFANDDDTFTGFVNAIGSTGANTITGSGGANLIDGIAGYDSLLGGGGADTLLGGDGADTLNGQAGVDRLEGGAGDDLYLFDGSADQFVELAGQGTDRVSSALTYTLVAGSNIENLSLTGTAAINGTGNELGNVIAGNGSANVLSGLAGADTLNGGGGSDSLNGGADSDRLIGGVGNDTYDGGAGTDTIAYTASFFGSGDVTAGTVEVLSGGIGDRIDFAAIFEGQLLRGGVVLGTTGVDVAIGGGAFEAGISNVRFLAATDVLQIDLNNDGVFTAGSDFQLGMAGVNSVTYNAAGDYFQLA